MTATVSTFDSLKGQSMVNLTTFRKNGEAVSTPVAFTIRDGKLYMITGKTTFKIKRIQQNARVQIAACDWNGKPLGSTLEGTARIVPDDEGQTLRRSIKFPVPAPLMFLFNLRRTLQNGGNVFLEITPV